MAANAVYETQNKITNKRVAALICALPSVVKWFASTAFVTLHIALRTRPQARPMHLNEHPDTRLVWEANRKCRS